MNSKRQSRAEEKKPRADRTPGEQESPLGPILNLSPDAVVVIDAEQRIRFFNQGAENIFGYRAEEVLGKSLDTLLPPETIALHRKHIQTFAAAPESARWMAERQEVSGQRKEGTLFPAEASIARWMEQDQPVFAVILRDLTERKRMEARLFQAQKMESIGRLAGGIAHDFNNLLTAVLGYTDMATERVAGDRETLLFLENIRKAVEHAAGLTNQLLAFARKQFIIPRNFDLNQRIRDLEPVLKPLLGEHFELILSLEERPVLVKADPDHIEQALMSLVAYVCHSMPGGGRIRIETAPVTLEATEAGLEMEIPPGEYARLSIRDTGDGLTEEMKQSLFEPFFTTRPRERGTGLGLASCYGIIRQNGGDIQVESRPGQGTTFHIYLPRIPGLASGLPREAAETPYRGVETILLVDDEPMICNIAALALKSQGYHVITAFSGAEALQKAETHSGVIPLLVTDVIMPQISGKQLADHLQRLGKAARVLYISGYTDNMLTSQGVLDAGVTLLAKPFSNEQLIRTVRRVLDTEPGLSAAV